MSASLISLLIWESIFTH